MKPSADRVESDLAALIELDATALRARWRELYGRSAPRYMRRDLLARTLAYRIQELAYGGLKPSTRRRLLRIATGEAHTGDSNRSATPILRPGVRLIREWDGQPHVVEVIAEGFAWRGACYPSLSSIARAITGTNWSGPRFFGLLDKRRPQSKEPVRPETGRSS